MIIQAIYAVRPVSRRHNESIFLEGMLDKWLVGLPDHLQYDPGSAKFPVPLPHVLNLHMQYWCAVLLLQRPLYVPFGLSLVILANDILQSLAFASLRRGM